MANYDFLVFIGRFQPFHIGHQHVVELALTQADHVIVLIGSANVARSVRDPFAYDERAEMIARVFPSQIAAGSLILQPVDDEVYNDDAWIAAVQKTVAENVYRVGNGGGVGLRGVRDFRVGLIGYGKDGSSYYLKKFPSWEAVAVKSQYGTFNSSEIRHAYLRRAAILPNDNCPPAIVDWLRQFRLGPDFAELVADAEAVREYHARYGEGPFITVDSVVTQAGHVLLIERGGRPGKGLKALPGGFLEPNETLREAAVRELKEETRIADHRGEIPAGVLASFIEDAATRVFDAPHRDNRARIITQCFLFRLPDRPELARVRGADDAARASWHRLGELDPREFYADHWSVLKAMLAF